MIPPSRYCIHWEVTCIAPRWARTVGSFSCTAQVRCLRIPRLMCHWCMPITIFWKRLLDTGTYCKESRLINLNNQHKTIILHYMKSNILLLLHLCSSFPVKSHTFQTFNHEGRTVTVIRDVYLSGQNGPNVVLAPRKESMSMTVTAWSLINLISLGNLKWNQTLYL